MKKITAREFKKWSLVVIERFSIECRKTKTKVIITANQNKGKF